ncbi:MAG: PDZ domain-containing protein [Anaerolineales bacterium]|nr:PDZ domain-containing protein [Anaerolineales bacterium]
MVSEKNAWSSIWGGVLAFLILVVPALVGYDLYLQWHAPTMDFYLDRPGSSIVHSVLPGGHAEAAGLQAGDVILTVDDTPFRLWYAPEIGQTHILKIERQGWQLSLTVPAVRLLQVNTLALGSAILVALAFWGIGTLLFLRRFWHSEIRLLFLITQTIAVTVLFPLSYQEPWISPPGLLAFSVGGLNLAAALLLHYALISPVKLGNPRRRTRGLIPVYSLVPVLFGVWLFNNQLGLQLTAVFFSLVVTAAIVFTIYGYRYRSPPDDRRRTRVIVFGALIATTPIVLLYVLSTVFNSLDVIPEWLAGLSLIIAPVSYLYATLRYNLFGIDRLINRTLVYAFLSFGIFGVYLGPYLFLYQSLPDELFIQLVFIFVLTLWVGWTFDWMRVRAQRLVDQLFYGGWYDYPGVVEMISAALARSSSREQIFNVLTNQVSSLMRLSSSYLWIGDSNSTFPAAPAAQVQARFRFKFQSDIPAQWTVGLHQDGDDLSDTDHRILRTLAEQAEIALNNAFLIEALRGQLEEIRASREALSQTQHQLLRSREEERARLARDLHDSPIQSLVGLNIQLGLLLNSKDLNLSTGESLKEMRFEVRRLSSELRQVCAELRPPMLDTLGLGAALRTLVTEWSDQNAVETRLDVSPDAALRSLPGEVAVNFYRVAQEALSNISKHAQARHVDISLLCEEDQLMMTIQDDGLGFRAPGTLHDLTAQSHFGLAGMRERIGLIGGEWSLTSTPGHGTIVRVNWRAEGTKR